MKNKDETNERKPKTSICFQKEKRKKSSKPQWRGGKFASNVRSLKKSRNRSNQGDTTCPEEDLATRAGLQRRSLQRGRPKGSFLKYPAKEAGKREKKKAGGKTNREAA